MPRLLDLFCGRFGWGRTFAERGWEVVGVDLVKPPETPKGCSFIQANIFDLRWSDAFRENRWFFAINGERHFIGDFDFICASSPCEQFSLHGMKHFHPNPPYPELGINLFNHTRSICENSGIPYLMENVRPAQKFVGNAVNHCGPFYMWGNAIPPLIPQGITKGISLGSGSRIKYMTNEEKRIYRKQFPHMQVSGISKERQSYTSKWAQIPIELSGCVADYAERILQQ